MLKRSDIRQGRTLYLVMAFPTKDRQFQENNSSIKKVRVDSRPFFVDGHPKDSYKFKRTVLTHPHSYIGEGAEYLSTWRIDTDNQYNHHKAFLSRRKAEAYAKRMASGCLTAAERAIALRMEEFDRSMKRFPVIDVPMEQDTHHQISWNVWDTPFTVNKPNAVIRIDSV